MSNNLWGHIPPTVEFISLEAYSLRDQGCAQVTYITLCIQGEEEGKVGGKENYLLIVRGEKDAIMKCTFLINFKETEKPNTDIHNPQNRDLRHYRIQGAIFGGAALDGYLQKTIRISIYVNKVARTMGKKKLDELNKFPHSCRTS